MKYIEQIILKNFQSHKHTSLKFNQGLNIIVGASDSGKTSILRAIKWVLYNEPLGDFFIREGEKETSVSLIFNNGVRVERYRGASKNQYKLFDGEEEMIFEGFGASVPLEVRQAIGIDKIELDQKESRTINLAEQLDGPFLLSEKPSVKASSIGRLVGANIVDDALRESLNDNRKISAERTRLLAENKGLEKEIESFAYLAALEEKLVLLEELKLKIRAGEELKARLESLHTSFQALRLEIDSKQEILSKLDRLDELGQLALDLGERIGYSRQLIRLGERMDYVTREKAGEARLLAKTEKLDLVTGRLALLDNKISSLSKLVRSHTRLIGLGQEKEGLAKVLARLEKIQELDPGVLEGKLVAYRRLLALEKAYKAVKKSLDLGRTYLDGFSGLELAERNYTRLQSQLRICDSLQALARAWEENRSSSQLGRDYIEDLRLSTIGLLKDYKELLKTAEVCPFCLSLIDEGHIDEIINRYMEDYDYEI